MRFDDKRKLIKRVAAWLAMILITTGISPGVSAAALPEELVPMGNTVGIQMSTDGVLVVGISVIQTENGEISPAGAAGILPGDILQKIGSEEVASAADFMSAMRQLDGSEISITIKRGDKIMQYSLIPVQSQDGQYQIGLWLRDKVAGIGTLTFYDPQTGMYGALGHSISDMDTGIIMPLGSGSIMNSSVVDVRKGISGTPGELCGCFEKEGVVGSILKNTSNGIFGYMTATKHLAKKKPLRVAGEHEIKLGKAVILCNITNKEVAEFEVEICRVYRNEDSGRSLMLTVTDQGLLDLTGGIVQGMSGSPIVQDGKLIGAVTHVLINDPTKGYGISITKMMEAALNDQVFDQTA